VTDRIESIDSLRAVAVVFVVIAHIRPFANLGAYGKYAYFVLDTLGQFDVPFFFMASGYFLAKTIDPDQIGSRLRRIGSKIASLYLFGAGVHLLAVALTAGLRVFHEPVLIRSSLAGVFEDLSVLGVVYYGDAIAVPLWFLTALFFATALVCAFVALGWTRLVLPVAASLHAVGLLGQTAPGVIGGAFPTRDALFFGFFYLALGYWLAASDWTPQREHRYRYLGAFCLLLVVQLGEQYAIGYIGTGASLSRVVLTTEYTLATIPLTLSLFVTALAYPHWSQTTLLPALGNYAVGVYLLHFPVYHVLQALLALTGSMLGIAIAGTVLWQALVTPVVCGLSLGLYLSAARVGLVELGGSHLPRLDRIRSRLGNSPSEPNQPAD
jgi:peptidoglycan/LPS O-acetylase OafA/YrhL